MMDPFPSIDLDELLLKEDIPLAHSLDAFSLPPLSPNAVLPHASAIPSFIDTTSLHLSSDGSREDQDLSPTQPTHPGGPSADPKERVRAKNRRAQTRYREKQKVKRKETEEALDKIQSDVERLRLENSRLVSHNTILENVLTVRDHTATILETSQSQEKKTLQSTQMRLLDRLQYTAPPLDKKAHACEEGWNACTGGALFAEGQGKDEKAHGHGHKQGNGNHNIEDGTCPLTNLSRSEVIALRMASHEAVQFKYKEYADRLRDVLGELEDPRASEHTKGAAREMMIATLMDCGVLCFEHAVLKPTAVQKLLSASVGESSVHAASAQPSTSSVEKATMEAWRGIMRSLSLTQAQCERFLPIKEVFLQRAERIASDRRRILSNLAGAMPVAEGAGESSNGQERGMEQLKTLQGATSSWLTLHAASQELEANLQDEHVAFMEFVAKGFGGILSPVQKAKAIVACYPAFPDMFAIANAAEIELLQGGFHGGGGGAGMMNVDEGPKVTLAA